MRLPLIIGAALASLAVAAPTTQAAALPTVNVRVADDAIVLSGHEHLGRGPVRLSFRRDGGREPRTINVIELKPGHEASDIGPLGGLVDARRVERVGRLVAGITARSETTAAVSFETKARRYVVIDGSDERQAYAEFEPDVEHSGAVLPAADATVTLRDDAITAPGVLPRRGAIRVRNTGARPHHALAIRLPARTTTGQAAAALRKGTSPERVGDPIDLEALLSAGADIRVERTLKPGRYVLVSFYAGTGATAKPDIYRGLLTATKVR